MTRRKARAMGLALLPQAPKVFWARIGRHWDKRPGTAQTSFHLLRARAGRSGTKKPHCPRLTESCCTKAAGLLARITAFALRFRTRHSRCWPMNSDRDGLSRAGFCAAEPRMSGRIETFSCTSEGSPSACLGLCVTTVWVSSYSSRLSGCWC